MYVMTNECMVEPFSSPEILYRDAIITVNTTWIFLLFPSSSEILVTFFSPATKLALWAREKEGRISQGLWSFSGKLRHHKKKLFFFFALEKAFFLSNCVQTRKPINGIWGQVSAWMRESIRVPLEIPTVVRPARSRRALQGAFKGIKP